MVRDEIPHSSEEGQIGNVRELVLLAGGFACFVAYCYVTARGYDAYYAYDALSFSDMSHILRACSTVAVFALLALAGWKGRFSLGTVGLCVACVAACAAPLIAAFGRGGMPWLLAAVLGGGSSAVLAYAWVMLLSGRGKRGIVVVTASGVIAAAAIVIVASRLQAEAAPVLVAAAALCAFLVVMSIDPKGAAMRPDGPVTSGQVRSLPLFTIVVMATVVFASTFLCSVAQHIAWLYDWHPNGFVLGVSAAAIVISTFGMMLTRDAWADEVWMPQLAILVFALALSCISLRESLQGAMGFMLASAHCSGLCCLVVIPAMLCEAKGPRAFLCAALLALMANSFGMVAGDAVGALLPHSLQNLGGVAGLEAIVVFAILATSWALIERRVRLDARGGGRGGDDDAQPATVEGRIAVLSDRFGLTPRESEVALLTAQGFSASYIAEKLVVSNSTVRFHQQNLYRKIDVHSRNEFIELVSS